MKVLLMYMPDTLVTFGFLIENFPAMSLESIAGNIDEGCDVKILDLLLCRKELRETIRKNINKFNPDIVGLSCMTFQYATAIKVAKFIKSLNKNIFIALGGYHPSLMHKEISESSDSKFIDFIIRGEGEIVFKELIDAINKNKGFEKINGLSYKKNGRFKHNPRSKLLDLNELKLPKRKDVYILKERRRAIGRPVVGLETSRGCTNVCKFCSAASMYGKSFRTYQIDRVLEDITMIKEAGFRSAFIVDDNIVLNAKRFKEICDVIKKEGHEDVIYTIQLPVRELATDRDISKKMSQAGFGGIWLGIENARSDVAAEWNKGATPKFSEKAVKNLHDFGMVVAGGIIMGNPEDGPDDFDANLKFAKKIKIDLPMFGICTPFPKTGLRKEMLEKDLIVNRCDFSKYNGGFAVCRTNKLSPEEVQFLTWKMIRGFYDFGWLITQFKYKYPEHKFKLLLKRLFYIFGEKIPFLSKNIDSWDKIGTLLLKCKLIYPFTKKSEREVFKEYLNIAIKNNVFDLD